MVDVDIYRSSVDGALHQGEILSGVVQYAPEAGADDTVSFVAIQHPFCVVLSQECDLGWDYLARSEDGSQTKFLGNVLLCTAHEEKEIREAKNLTSSIFKRVKQNKDERFQYLEECPAAFDLDGSGVPPLILDFKGYFTVPTEHLYAQLRGAGRRCCLNMPYAEHLSSRFAYFQSRLALPRDHGMPVR